jgi:hypothetical protein
VKFSARQMLASAVGAVLAAAIASFFGVKGTIVGVAIGSVAATAGTALVAQSIERTHAAVKQVVVHVPDRSSLLRRLGGTRASGADASSAAAESALVEGTTTSAASGDAVAPTAQVAPMAEAAQTEEVAQTTQMDQTAQLPLTAEVAEQAQETAQPAVRVLGLRWPVVAGIVAAVFVASLLLVTAVELIAGRPLADLFNSHSGGGTSVEKIFQPSPTTVPLPAPTTTTSTSSSTTTSSTTSSTTSTSVVSGTTTTTGTGSTGTTTTSTSGTPSTSTTTTTSLP